MRLLALDCAAGTCAAACTDGSSQLAAFSEPTRRGHAERIVPMLAETLKSADLVPKQIDVVAVTVGPGAFTGIRIGLAAAQGFALPLNIPIIGVGCLEVAASPLTGTANALVALETKRKDFYIQAFDINGMPTTKPVALRADEIPNFLPNQPHSVIGDAADRLIAELDSALSSELTIDHQQPENTAVEAARIAAGLAASGTGQTVSMESPKPLYLRPPDVNLKGRESNRDP